MILFISLCEVFPWLIKKGIIILHRIFTNWKNSSQYTIENYKRDIHEFFLFLNEQGIEDITSVEYFDVRLYLTNLYEKNLSKRTVARKTSCLRSLYRFLLREGDVKDNPFSLASLPKKDQRLPRFLYEKEMNQLFSTLKKDSPIGIRNNALLELLYATGIRVSECCEIKLQDIDLSLGTVLIHGKGKRIATFRLVVMHRKR